MAIRVKHGSVKDFAQLAKLAGQSVAADKAAERQERQAMAMREMQGRQLLQQQELQVRQEMAADAMEFERTKEQGRREFAFQMEIQRQANDFEMMETKRLQKVKETDAALKAIDEYDGLTPEAKRAAKAEFLASQAGGRVDPRALYGDELKDKDDKQFLQQQRMMNNIATVDRQITAKQEYLGSFEDIDHPIKRVMTLGMGGAPETKRRIGKNSVTATEGDLSRRKEVQAELVQLQNMKEQLYQQFNEAIGDEDLAVQGEPTKIVTPEDISGMSPTDKMDRVRELTAVNPATEGEVESKYAELYLLNPKVADAWLDQQRRRFEKTEEAPKAPKQQGYGNWSPGFN